MPPPVCGPIELIETQTPAVGDPVPVWGGQPAQNHTVDIVCTGAPTAVTVRIRGGLIAQAAADPTIDTLATHIFSAAELAEKRAVIVIQGMPMFFVYAEVVTMTGVTALTARYIGL